MMCETCAGPDGREFGAYQVCAPCQKKHWGKVIPELVEERYEPNYTDELLEEDAQRWERDLRDHGSDPEDQSWEDIMGGVYDEYFTDDVEAVERDRGASRADRLCEEWSDSKQEYDFLIALSGGHSLAEARRLSGLTIGRARYLVQKIERAGWTL